MSPQLPSIDSFSINEDIELRGLPLTYVLGIENLNDFRVHCAVQDGSDPGSQHPLDAYWTGRWHLLAWNANAPHQGGGGKYNKGYNIALTRWGDHKKNLWLFCCIYEVLSGWRKVTEEEGPNQDYDRWLYELKSADIGKGHSGRLIVKAPFRGVMDVRRDLDTPLSDDQLLSNEDRLRDGNLLSDNIVVHGELEKPYRNWKWF